MPRLVERDVKYELSQIERDIYETLLEEDELTASQKIHVLQKFLLNPELLDTTPGIQGSKIKAVSSALHETFENMDKVVMFVNRYAKGGYKRKLVHCPEAQSSRRYRNTHH